jgi:hypothetical protein
MLVRAKTTFVSTYYGRPEVVSPNDIFDSEDILVLDRPDMFEEIVPTRVSEPRRNEPVIEQATAAPGEKRQGTRRP